jgi:hypothetical protein
LSKYESDLAISNFIKNKLKQINDDDLKNLSLNAILIKPVQRITKYSLFIDQLIKVRPIVRYLAKCLKKIEILPEHGRDPL